MTTNWTKELSITATHPYKFAKISRESFIKEYGSAAESFIKEIESLAEQRTDERWREKISKDWDKRYKCTTPMEGGGLCRACQLEKDHDLSDLLK